MAVTTSKVEIGVCDVTYGGLDLGATKGGVSVEIKTTTYEAKVDQFGETPIKEIITGTTVMVKVPMAETDLVRLHNTMPQSTISTGGAAPTGFSVNHAGGYAVGVKSVVLHAGTGTPVAGGKFSFAGHASVYKITGWNAGTSTLSFVADFDGASGLVAPIADSEALTFQAVASAVTITSGINTDLLQISALLKLHPTGVDPLVTDGDFIVYLAGISPNFSFKYEFAAERVYEVTFKGYPDTLNGNRIAAFGNG
jgi:hypothetical protein